MYAFLGPVGGAYLRSRPSPSQGRGALFADGSGSLFLSPVYTSTSHVGIFPAYGLTSMRDVICSEKSCPASLSETDFLHL